MKALFILPLLALCSCANDPREIHVRKGDLSVEHAKQIERAKREMDQAAGDVTFTAPKADKK